MWETFSRATTVLVRYQPPLIIRYFRASFELAAAAAAAREREWVEEGLVALSLQCNDVIMGTIKYNIPTVITYDRPVRSPRPTFHFVRPRPTIFNIDGKTDRSFAVRFVFVFIASTSKLTRCGDAGRRLLFGAVYYNYTWRNRETEPVLHSRSTGRPGVFLFFSFSPTIRNGTIGNGRTARYVPYLLVLRYNIIRRGHRALL